MENTLISHVLNQKVVRLGPTSTYSGLSFDNNILISELNDYDMIYNVESYLFRADTDHGKSVIRGLYDLIPENTEHIFVLYTNTIKSINLTRIIQNIWAFKSDQEVDQFMPEMIEQLSWAKSSHLIELPYEPDFAANNWIENFVDPYYYVDYQKILNQTNMRYHLINEKQLKQLVFKPSMSFADFTRYDTYNHQVYEAEKKLVNRGLSKYINDECVRLNRRRSFLMID